MKLLMLAGSLLLTAGLGGCVVAPGYDGYGYDGGYGPVGGGGGGGNNGCPPGQAKKGNCYPGGGFCPPGLKKQGRCNGYGDGRGDGAVVVDPGVRVRVPQVRVDPGGIEVR